MTMTMRSVLILLAACGLLLLLLVARHADASQVGAKDVRFQLIGNEPIAAPDGQAVVRGWSVLMFKDRESGDCYVAFSRGDAIATAPAKC